MWTMAATTQKRKRPPEIATHFVRRLKQLREEKGWSQGDLAEKLGVKRTAIANYEQAVSFPPLPALEKMAKVFGVSLDGLVWGAVSPEEAIRDRNLLEAFRRMDRLNHRAKASLLDVIEAVLEREEREEKRRNSTQAA
jgi:transcriptional regulator with XRE-family HTH domain